MVVRFVDIGRIYDCHCLIFLFIILGENDIGTKNEDKFKNNKETSMYFILQSYTFILWSDEQKTKQVVLTVSTLNTMH